MWTHRFNFEVLILAFVVAICLLHWLFFVFGVLKGGIWEWHNTQ
jgi:hypothetical protein